MHSAILRKNTCVLLKRKIWGVYARRRKTRADDANKREARLVIVGLLSLFRFVERYDCKVFSQRR